MLRETSSEMSGSHKGCEEKRRGNRERALLAQNEELLESDEGLFLGLRSWFVLLLLFSKTGFTGEAYELFFFFSA